MRFHGANGLMVLGTTEGTLLTAHALTCGCG